jgi:hypothetical protein
MAKLRRCLKVGIANYPTYKIAPHNMLACLDSLYRHQPIPILCIIYRNYNNTQHKHSPIAPSPNNLTTSSNSSSTGVSCISSPGVSHAGWCLNVAIIFSWLLLPDDTIRWSHIASLLSMQYVTAYISRYSMYAVGENMLYFTYTSVTSYSDAIAGSSKSRTGVQLWT